MVDIISISGSIILLWTWLHDCSTYYDNYVYCATCNEIFDRKSSDPWPIGRHMLPVCMACDSDGWIPWCVIINIKGYIKIVICQIWMTQMKFQIYDFRSGISLKIGSEWCIGHPDWWRSDFPAMWLKHKHSRSRCHWWNLKILTSDLDSPENSGPDDVWITLIGGGQISPKCG